MQPCIHQIRKDDSFLFMCKKFHWTVRQQNLICAVWSKVIAVSQFTSYTDIQSIVFFYSPHLCFWLKTDSREWQETGGAEGSGFEPRPQRWGLIHCWHPNMGQSSFHRHFGVHGASEELTPCHCWTFIFHICLSGCHLSAFELSPEPADTTSELNILRTHEEQTAADRQDCVMPLTTLCSDQSEDISVVSPILYTQ